MEGGCVSLSFAFLLLDGLRLLDFAGQVWVLLHGEDLLNLFWIQVVFGGRLVRACRTRAIPIRKDIGRLPEHRLQALLDVLALDLFAVLADPVQTLKVVAHVFHLRVLLDLAIAHDFVVVVQVADVCHEVGGQLLGDLNWKVEYQCTAKISPCLHQVVRTEVIVLEWAHIVTTE